MPGVELRNRASVLSEIQSTPASAIHLGKRTPGVRFPTVKRPLMLGSIWLCLALGSLPANGIAPDSPANPLRTGHLLETGQQVRIVCFGDSVTGVYYHTGNRRAWCDLVGIALQRLYPRARLEMINAGISGNSTADALPRMADDVLRHRPQLVIAMFGLNDVTRVSPDDFRANLRQIVQRSRQVGAEVVLMTPNLVSAGDGKRPPEKVAAYAQITREVGQELAVPVTDIFRAFQSVQTTDHRAWLGIMSDSIHPNLRGHKLLAAEAVRTMTGQRVSLAELPVLQPGLPRVLARLQAKETVRIIAMKPYDALVGPALQKLYPGAQIEVTTWDATGKSLALIEAQAKALGWAKFREQPNLTRPDLYVLAVPAEAGAASEDEFFHSYTWIMNWSLSFNPPNWDCLVILPSVAQPDQDQAQHAAECLAREVIQGQDLPWLQRTPGDARPTAELLGEALGALLEAPKP